MITQTGSGYSLNRTNAPMFSHNAAFTGRPSQHHRAMTTSAHHRTAAASHMKLSALSYGGLARGNRVGSSHKCRTAGRRQGLTDERRLRLGHIATACLPAPALVRRHGLISSLGVSYLSSLFANMPWTLSARHTAAAASNSFSSHSQDSDEVRPLSCTSLVVTLLHSFWMLI